MSTYCKNSLSEFESKNHLGDRIVKGDGPIDADRSTITPSGMAPCWRLRPRRLIISDPEEIPAWTGIAEVAERMIAPTRSPRVLAVCILKLKRQAWSGFRLHKMRISGQRRHMKGHKLYLNEQIYKTGYNFFELGVLCTVHHPISSRQCQDPGFPGYSVDVII